MSATNATRGYGFLENFLALKRCEQANRLIPDSFRKGRILDIGSGACPIFLLSTDFAEKYSIDKIGQNNITPNNNKIIPVTCDIEKDYILPFDDDYFDVVTMLAVFEHIAPERLGNVLKEIRRVLKKDGMYIMTTPAVWTDSILRVMAKLRLVSPVEIAEHKGSYSHSKISTIFEMAGFSKNKLRLGYFEAFMNVWATVVK